MNRVHHIRVTRSFIYTCILVSLGLATSCRKPIATAPDREAIASAVRGFHEALAKGDRGAAMSLLAEDAQILETGHRQTREEYEAEHLAADIEFAKAVPAIQGALIVRQEGTLAWTTSTSRSSGQFHAKEVDSENAELMVLAKKDEEWKIRAIHWSSHAHR